MEETESRMRQRLTQVNCIFEVRYGHVCTRSTTTLNLGPGTRLQIEIMDPIHNAWLESCTGYKTPLTFRPVWQFNVVVDCYTSGMNFKGSRISGTRIYYFLTLAAELSIFFTIMRFSSHRAFFLRCDSVFPSSQKNPSPSVLAFNFTVKVYFFLSLYFSYCIILDFVEFNLVVGTRFCCKNYLILGMLFDFRKII